MATSANNTGCLDQCSPVRNRYFYGKMLDVYHFELEQNYFNSKRWLLNRLVSGYGVVCGLNVLLSSDGKSLYVTPGVAIDKCGHEIVLCQPSVPVPLPPPSSTAGGGSQTTTTTTGTNPQQPTTTTSQPAGTSATTTGASATGTMTAGTGTENCDCAQYYHLVLCYHECPTDPAPSLGGDCGCSAQTTCSPGAIRERYTLELVTDKLAQARTTSSITDVINGGTVNYCALVNYVANLSFDDPCPDCCIPLANIRVPDLGQTYDQTNIDICIRPLVYSNDVLYELILALKQGSTTTAARKP